MLELQGHTVIYRKYISVNPEVRINKRWFETGEERFHLTVKDDEKLARKEVKIQLSEEQYQELSAIIKKQDLIFDIYEFRLDENHNISFKEGRNVEIKFAEIEYENREDYESYRSIIENLTFLEKEVTYDENYYVKKIWEEFCR